MMDRFWPHVLPGHFGNDSFENVSIDVARKDCFADYDATACVRNSLLSCFGILTLFLCIGRILKLHFFHHPQVHQYLVFYLATLEVLFLIVRWIALITVFQLEFAASYLKLLQFILLCHFHWLLVSRILHQKRLISWVIVPLLCAYFGFLTAVSVMGMVTHLSTWVECLAPHWLLLSIAETLGILLYAVAGMYITRKINSISALDTFKWEQKRDLWSVIMTYAFSSITSLLYYGTLQALASFETGCSGVFDHTQEIYSPIYAVFVMIRYFLPIWVMIMVFYPLRGVVSTEDERLLGWSGSGSTTSVFSPRYEEFYKQLIPSVESGCEEHSTLRRSASSPAFFIKPPLSPISEEDLIFPASSRLQYESYGAMGTTPEARGFISRRSPGWPTPHTVPVSVNQCSDEIENVTPSSEEKP